MPWTDWLSFGLGVLRWPPDMLWRATPRELMLAARVRRAAAPPRPLDRAALADLIARYPDRRTP